MRNGRINCSGAGKREPDIPVEEFTSQLPDVEEYETPHPEGITSLCYSCKRYIECNVRTSTCTSCDQYINKTEAYKSQEERYSEEQDKIDRETKKKLQEIDDEKKMEILPSDRKRIEIEKAQEGLLGYVCGELCSKTQADSCEKVCENCKLMNYVEQLKEAYERDYRK